MILRVYDFLSAEKPKFIDNILGVISDCTSLKYTRRAYDIGSFDLSVPKNADNAELLLPDRLILFGDDIYARHIMGTDTDSLTSDCLYITEVSSDEFNITVTGYDLKYFLAQRVTLFPQTEQDKGTYGYYVTSGTTFGCLSNLLNYNIVNSTDENRKIFGLSALVMPVNQIEAGYMGLKNDKYMTRLESLSSAFFNLMKNCKSLWWEVRVALNNSDGADSYVPRCESIEDKKTVFFCEDKYNIKSYSLDNGVSGYKNAIYAVAGSNDVSNAVVKLVNRDETPASGVGRKEISLTVDTDTVAEIDEYTLKAAEDYTVTDSFEVQPLCDDGVEVCLAQKVAVKIDRKIYYTQVVEITDEYTADSKKTTYVTGTKKIKAINVINKLVAGNTQQIISNKLSQGVGQFTNSSRNSERFNDYNGNTISGDFDHAEGMGNRIQSSTACHAEGMGNNIADTQFAHASGQSNKVIGGNANTATGYGNEINCGFAVNVDGQSNVANGCTATSVCGANNTVQAWYTQVGGMSNAVTAHRSAVSGSSNTVSGIEQIVGGYNNTVSEFRNIVSGMGNEVSGYQNIANGQSNTISGNSNGVVGSSNNVSNNFSVVGGQNNTINGGGNVVGGSSNTVSGSSCITDGMYNEVGGTGNIAVGYDLIVGDGTSFSAVFGRYNVAKNIPFAIGNGTGDNSRSNILELDYDGNFNVAGTINAEGGYVNAPEPQALTNLEIAEMLNNITGG